MSAEILDDRSVVAVHGPDARTFLQGLITNDIGRLAPGRAIYSALLTPQGKVLFDFLLTEDEGAILIDCATSKCEGLVKRLSLYRLRAKVSIDPRNQLCVLAAPDNSTALAGISFVDPRVADLGWRSICSRPGPPQGVPSRPTYLERRLQLGIPEGDDFGLDKMFALDADLDELQAIDFEKGCYVGQELTARMKHRSTARKRLLPVATLGETSLAPRDTPVLAGGRAIGEVVSSYGREGFAQLRLDRLGENETAATEAGGVAIRIRRPKWLFA